MKKIYEMSIDEMVDELRAFCSTRRECKRCELSLINHLGEGDIGHEPFGRITDRHFLGLMVAIARGYLVLKYAENDPNDPEADYFNASDQPTVPPMPEPVESIESSVETTLTAELPEDATMLVISGKKPTSVTVFYDQEGGGDS